MMPACLFAVCLAASPAPWFVVNEDNDHFFKCDSSLMTEKGLSDYVDYICRGKVTHVFFCVSGQRTSYDSKTWEPIWAGQNEKARPDTATRPDGTHDRWAVNCKALFDAGIDPYAVWIRRCREKGVKPWVSMRMNDVHFGADSQYFRNTSWYKAHPEFRLDPSGTNDCWFMQQLDYAHKEVRDYTMAQVKEVASRWPADGMELDWMRFGHVFRPNEELKNAPILDAFMREASAAIRASGKQVAVRVPYDHEVCAEFGFDVVRWAKEGLVDVVIPAPFIRSASNLPVGKWIEALKGTDVRLVPDLGCEVGCSDRAWTPAVYRGVAESFFAQGASGVCLYNLPYKSNALYSSDSRGKAWCENLDVAAELYANGILPDDLRGLDIDCPPMVHDWPDRSMRNEAKWDAFFAREAPRYRALQAAIDAKSAAGGGRVEIGGTVYCDGPLRLKSGVELHFADGARLVFTDNPARYLPVVPTSFEGVECLNYSPLIYTFGQTNVAITGHGTIEPRIDRWIDWYDRTPEYKISLRKVYDWCCDGEPVANRDLTKLAGMDVRPQLVQFNRCGNVRLEGFRVRKSPFWVLHFLLCDGVVVKDLDVIGIGRNNDGLDLEMTRNVLVDGCSFREGDDAIVVKAGRNHDGWRLATPSENIEIRNCRISRGNAILGIGSEMSGGVRNVWMHDCVFDGFGGSLLELKTNERRGGFIRDIRVENVSAPGVLLGSVLTIATDCHYQWKDFPTREVRVAEISGITMRNVRAFKAGRVLNVRGDARCPVRNLTIENVTAEEVKAPDVVEAVADAGAPVGPPEPHAEAIVRRILAEVARIKAQDPLAVPMAFWDFDGTIIRGDSGFGLTENGRVRYRGLIEDLILNGLNSIYAGADGFLRWQKDYRYMTSLGPWLAQAFDVQMYVGIEEAKIDARCCEAIREQRLPRWYYASSMAMWKALAEAGVENCVVSANAEPLIRNLAPTLGVPPERVRGVRVASENGRWTTRILYPLPQGEGKAETVREMVRARPHGVAVAAFGNSYGTDKWFLRHVATQDSLPGGAKGTAVMINGGSPQPGFTEHFICVRQENVIGDKEAGR